MATLLITHVELPMNLQVQYGPALPRCVAMLGEGISFPLCQTQALGSDLKIRVP